VLDVDPTQLLGRVGAALAVGLMVGVERGWSMRDHLDHQRVAGLRTFALSGLLGGIATLFDSEGQYLVLLTVFTAYSAVIASFYWILAKSERDLSVTSVIAGMLTFLLGALAASGEILIALAGAVTVTSLLALRSQLHDWVAALTWPELSSTLTLLAMTFLLLPVLPNRSIDPWNAVNPHDVWLLTIMVATISFAGYVARAMLGDGLGILASAAIGGLASSTATTVSLASLGRHNPDGSKVIAAGVIIAEIVMIFRVVFLAATLNLPTALDIAPPLTAATAVLGLSAFLLLRSGNLRKMDLPRTVNPLELRNALTLAVVVAAVMLGASVMHAHLGTPGLMLVSVVSGAVDVDANTITVARLAAGGLDRNVAATAILLAILSNTISKAAIAWTAGPSIGGPVFLASALATIIGVSGFQLMTGTLATG
jgi:uncharacterized membrane protein (DUF4010 family)